MILFQLLNMQADIYLLYLHKYLPLELFTCYTCKIKICSRRTGFPISLLWWGATGVPSTNSKISAIFFFIQLFLQTNTIFHKKCQVKTAPNTQKYCFYLTTAKIYQVSGRTPSRKFT